LNRLVYGTLTEADAVLFVLDATQKIGPGDRLIAERVGSAETPVLVVVNKVDAASRDDVAERLAMAGEWDFAAYIPVSALESEGLAPILTELVARLPEGPAFFPADMKTDQPERFLVGEIVREKFLARLREELPHSLTVLVEEMEVRSGGALYVDGLIIVERDSQKGIVIGKGGAVLRDSGSEARKELESIFGTRVFLDLRVKVEKDWQRRDHLLDRLGF
jgi:GTP-binding protein Era